MQAIAAANCSSDRAAALFDDSLNMIHRRADRLFAWLMIAQWIAGIAAAVWISPRTWIGAESQTHWHVWAAIFLGGALTSLPAYFAHAMPGRALTRHTIAVAQMLFSALLIHLTGGRIETHFHVFGSLAFLAFYEIGAFSSPRQLSLRSIMQRAACSFRNPFLEYSPQARGGGLNMSGGFFSRIFSFSFRSIKAREI
jgi:hypothetical protein